LGIVTAATIAWLLGQPYYIPNMLSTSRIVGWKIVVTYALLAFAASIISGLIYGILVGGF